MSGKSLTDCPSNLKEAIDWILRVTGKDGGSGGNGSSGLATAVNALISTSGINIKPKITISKNLIESLATGLATFIGYSGNGQIGNGGIAVGKDGNPGEPLNPTDSGTRGYKLTYHRDQATWQNQVVGSQGQSTAAKIFLGCLPMIFSALSYLYWRCDIKGNGEWRSMSLKGDSNGHDLKNFMIASGYKSSEFKDRMYGDQIVERAMTQQNFNDLSEGITTAASTAKERATKEGAAIKIIYPSSPIQADDNPTYPEFNRALQQKGAENIQRQSTDNSFSILFHISRLYFNAKQSALSESPGFKPRPPSTIREMLYFLAALPYSPAYGPLNSHISKIFQTLFPLSSTDDDAERMIPVADSSTDYPNNTLSAANLKDYLTATCSLSLTVLGIIQGSGASEKPGEPWLHELFCNSAFYLNYPSSGPTLFSSLSNYTYALQFQLYFLYAQCYSTYSQGCGWRGCRYGSSINKSPGSTVSSHICSAGCNQDSHNNGYHSIPPTCKHKACTNSPLQAFLTDNIKGFSLSGTPDPTSLNHFDNHPPGSMCHVKMGFNPEHLRQNAGTGNYIYSVLSGFCGSPDTPLRQLSEKLGCFTKRTPRTLGDVFGFIWHLNSQLFKTRPTLGDLIDKFDKAFGLGNNLKQTFSSDRYAVLTKIWNAISQIRSKPQGQSSTATVLSRSLSAMAPAIPFLYQLFMADDVHFLPGALFDLTQHCHKWEGDQYKHEPDSSASIPKHDCSQHTADLWSLYNPIGDKAKYPNCSNKNCGGYLEPLTFTDGVAFSPFSAPAYLSWMVYLTDDLYEKLSEMRDDFNNISCEQCGSQCNPRKSCHATSAQCSCASVVTCTGVIPLIYRHGLQFYGSYSLNGFTWEHRTKSWKPDSSIKRNCQNFHSALSNVLSPDAPLAKLLESIDSFLYMFRLYFFYNLSSFWLCSLIILLYFIFYGIDVLHLQSHVHLPSSHTVPPIGLLTTGKAPVLTKLTYYMP
ncbi:variant erythrocyte surface antigen-1 family protein [Babesia caballi]|uniref:Variant erythrocyte surface antigen-1 family protein n=1 Tax=Babesia caballi TaxID=5871 RepID=A0AAV4LRR7_BABCB|nr:variant erythrocyte surface antigen-1 family protein [Babesia caballi]